MSLQSVKDSSISLREGGVILLVVKKADVVKDDIAKDGGCCGVGRRDTTLVCCRQVFVRMRVSDATERKKERKKAVDAHTSTHNSESR